MEVPDEGEEKGVDMDVGCTSAHEKMKVDEMRREKRTE